MNNKLIILRGPSGAGKSTVARALQKQSRQDAVIVEQDYYRQILMAGKPDDKNIVPDMITHNTLALLNADYTVILEGIFRKEKYLPMFQSLAGSFAGEIYTFYFDISFHETTKRHLTRHKAAQFGTDEMQKWYSMAEPLGLPGERHISEDLTESEIIQIITKQTGM